MCAASVPAAMGLAARQCGPVLGLLIRIAALSLLAPMEGAPTNPVTPSSNPVPLELSNPDASSNKLGGNCTTIRQTVLTCTPPVPPRQTTALPSSGLGPSDAGQPTVTTIVTLATPPPALESTDSSETTSQELQEAPPPSSEKSLDPPAGFTTGVPVTTESMSCELTTETPEGSPGAPDVLSTETTTVYSREYDAQHDPIENRLGLQRKDMVNMNQAANLLNLKQIPAPTPEVIFVRYKATTQLPLFNTAVRGLVSTQAREFSISTSRDFDFRDISKRDIVRSWSESGGSLDFASKLRRSTQKRERCRAYNAAVEVNSILSMDSDGRSVGGSPVFEFVRRGVPHFGDLCNVLDEGPVTEAHPWYRPTHVRSSGEKNVIDHSGLTIKAPEIVKLFSSRYRNS